MSRHLTRAMCRWRLHAPAVCAAAVVVAALFSSDNPAPAVNNRAGGAAETTAEATAQTGADKRAEVLTPEARAATTAEVAAAAKAAAKGTPDPPAGPSPLDRVVPHIDLAAASLEDAIDALSVQTKANIVVRWRVLRDAGVDRTAPVRVRLWDLPLSKALSVVLAAVSDQQVQVSWEMTVDGIIVVSTADDLNAAAELRIYDVRRLADDIRAASLNYDGEFAMTTYGVVQELVRVVRTEVKGDGAVSAAIADGDRVRELAGRLMATLTPADHRRAERVLRDLRDKFSSPAPAVPDKAGATRPAPPPAAGPATAD